MRRSSTRCTTRWTREAERVHRARDDRGCAARIHAWSGAPLTSPVLTPTASCRSGISASGISSPVRTVADSGPRRLSAGTQGGLPRSRAGRSFDPVLRGASLAGKHAGGPSFREAGACARDPRDGRQRPASPPASLRTAAPLGGRGVRVAGGSDGRVRTRAPPRRRLPHGEDYSSFHDLRPELPLRSRRRSTESSFGKREHTTMSCGTSRAIAGRDRRQSGDACPARVGSRRYVIRTRSSSPRVICTTASASGSPSFRG